MPLAYPRRPRGLVGGRSIGWDGIGSPAAFVVSRNLHRRHVATAHFLGFRFGGFSGSGSAVAWGSRHLGSSCLGSFTSRLTG